MQRWRWIAFAIALVSSAPALAAWDLSYVTPSRFGFFNGTTNVVSFDGATRAAACFRDVTIPGAIIDGTSNTIVLGEATGLRLIPGFVSSPLPINEILDGTSNTLLFGETSPTSACFGDVQIPTPILTSIVDGTSNTVLFGENTTFDICFNNARLGTIVDGTSNTILFGETQNGLCYRDVRVAEDFVVSAPEPGTLVIFACGLFLLIATVNRRTFAVVPR